MESASLCSKSKARFISGQINSTTVHSAPTQFGADFTVFIRLDLAVAALFGVELRFSTRSHLGALLLLATTVLVDIAGKNRRCCCFFLGRLCSGSTCRFRFGFRFFYRCFRLFCRFSWPLSLLPQAFAPERSLSAAHPYAILFVSSYY